MQLEHNLFNNNSVLNFLKNYNKNENKNKKNNYKSNNKKLIKNNWSKINIYSNSK